jgi:hypothetical protein
LVLKKHTGVKFELTLVGYIIHRKHTGPTAHVTPPPCMHNR